MNTIVYTRRITAALLAAAFVPFATAQMAGQATAATSVAATAAANAAANAAAAHQSAMNAATVAAGNVNAAAQTVAANVNAAATNAASQAQTGVQNASVAATNVADAASTVSANVTAAGQGATDAGASSTAGHLSAAGGVNNTASASAGQSGLSAGATTDVSSSLRGHTAASDPDLNTSISGSAALDTSVTTRQIRAAVFATRNELAADVEAKINAANQAVATMRSHAGELSAQARASFQAAVARTRTKEAQVRACLRAIRVSSAEKFDTACHQLADNFSAYASAVAQVEAAGAVSGGKN